jgi:predicted metal-dependent phosphoesterase TrpH
MVRAAAECGLQAVAITDHDVVKGHREALAAGQRFGVIVIPGVEISTSEGHLLALGINEPLPKGKTVPETIDSIHERNGVAIAAHPFDFLRGGIGKSLVRYISMIDGIETINGGVLAPFSNSRAQSFAKEYQKPTLGGSDAHATFMIGSAWTDLLDPPSQLSSQGIIKTIKQGRVKAGGGTVGLWAQIRREWLRRKPNRPRPP